MLLSVLIGFDTENTSEKIRNTCIMLGRDVVYLATNPDLVCPVSFGFIPDCGSMSIMLKNATGKEPFFIGKPQPIMVDCVLKNTGCSAGKPSLWEIGCILTSLPAKMRAWMHLCAFRRSYSERY